MKGSQKKDSTKNKRKWTMPQVTAVGTIGQVLQSGNGKTTVATGDPGEPQKVAVHG